MNLDTVIDLVLEHYPRSRKWEGDHLKDWLIWNFMQQFCFMVRDGDRLVGFGICRTIMDLDDAGPSLNFDPEGDTFCVDLAIALPPHKHKIMASLSRQVLKRFGQRDKICFMRNGEGPLLVRDARRYHDKLLGNARKELV